LCSKKYFPATWLDGWSVHPFLPAHQFTRFPFLPGSRVRIRYRYNFRFDAFPTVLRLFDNLRRQARPQKKLKKQGAGTGTVRQEKTFRDFNRRGSAQKTGIFRIFFKKKGGGTHNRIYAGRLLIMSARPRPAQTGMIFSPRGAPTGVFQGGDYNGQSRGAILLFLCTRFFETFIQSG